MQPQDQTTLRIERAISQFESGGKLLRTSALHGGISSRMTEFEIERADGSKARRIARQPSEWKFTQIADAAEVEARTIRQVKMAGIAVPKVLFVEQASEEVPHPFYVLEYVEGHPNLSPANVSRFVEDYASQLAKIHKINLWAMDFSFLPRPTIERRPRDEVSNAKLREAEIQQAIEQHQDRKGANPNVLRHGDFWPGNVIWREEKIVAVIDWEETVIGEPLFDLAISRLDLLWVVGMKAMEEFTERYFLLTKFDASGMAYWDLVASLRPMANLGGWASSYPGLGRPDITEATMTEGQEFVERALSRLSSQTL
jgi:aminoglycoside phosphotransferase (APT) family kinase protein